jgi:hypothetical protein
VCGFPAWLPERPHPLAGATLPREGRLARASALALDAPTDRARRRITVNVRDAATMTDGEGCGSIAAVLAEVFHLTAQLTGPFTRDRLISPSSAVAGLWKD